MPNDNEKKMVLKCIIDTMQLKISIYNFKDLSKITKENYSYITPLGEKINKDGVFKILKFNPNKVNGFGMLNSLKELKINLNKALDDMEVNNKKEININRVDIAIDNDLSFKTEKEFKFLLLIFELATFETECINRWYTTNLDTLKNNTIFKKSRDIDVCFYNKEEESNGKHPYKSRMEWRFKRVSTLSYEKHLDKLIVDIKLLDEKIEGLEKAVSGRLIKLWREEKEELQSFSEFVRKYKTYFYTINVLKMVYKESGLKGGYKGWLDNFRRANNGLIFYTKSDLEKFKKKMIKAIKTYKKS